jgi:drug/metabolite transporter (DMT)-like permease
VSVLALALVLTGAVVHAGWNLLLAGAPDSEAAGAVALASGAVLFAPVAVATWDVSAAAWPYIAASALLELTYFILLGRAYHHAELSLVYPIARGSAPVLVLIVSGVLGTALSFAQVLGILAVAGGIVAIRGIGRAVDRRDVLLALGVGATIAGYTLVDKEGLHHAGPLPYLEVVNALAALAYLPLLAWARGSRVASVVAWARWRGGQSARGARSGRLAASEALATLTRPRSRREAGARARLRTGAWVLRDAVSPRSVGAGAGVFGAYALTLEALKRAPAAPVAALRETSVLFATAFGAVVLHERVTAARAAGAVAVVAGVALVALG